MIEMIFNGNKAPQRGAIKEKIDNNLLRIYEALSKYTEVQSLFTFYEGNRKLFSRCLE